MLFQRTLTTLSSLFLALVAGSVAAQSPVALELTYQAGAAPKTCIFTTDAGVSMSPSNRLVASGTFGAGCPTSVAPGTPSFSDPLTNDLAAGVTTNATLSLGWRADADRCVTDGSLFPSGVSYPTWPVSGEICNSAATCNVPHAQTFTASANGAYKFKLSCYKEGNTTPAVSEANTVASAIPTGCPGPAGTTRQTSGTVCDVGMFACRGVDMTKFENVFGYNQNQPSQPNMWPGTYNLQQRPSITNNQFVALAFTVPANYPTNKYGYLMLAETNFQGRMSMTISSTCGDFGATNPISQKCILNDGGASSQMLWSTYTSGSVYNGSCHLTAGQTYYLNMIYAPIATPGSSSCAEGSCANAIQNGTGNF